MPVEHETDEPAPKPATETPETDAGTAGQGTAAAPGEAPAEAPHYLPSPPQVHHYADAKAIAEAAAKRFLDSAKRAVEARDRFIVVLAGGSTPRALYERLAQDPYRKAVPWDRTYFVFGDERCVPPDHADSNYRMAHEALLAPLEIDDLKVLRMKGEQIPADAARRYAVRLGDLFLGHTKRRFDLTLLGIGADGHTASLFPGTEALAEEERWVVANHVPKLDAWRLTLTFKALNATRRVIFMATGESKARVVAEAFGDIPHEPPHPVEGVAPLHSRREVLLDHAAASLIPKKDRGEDKR